jgi:hypothetical protein
MQHLREFAAGKAEAVAFKSFNIIKRYLKRDLIFNQAYGTVPYQNKWGKHLGVLAFDRTSRRWYRLNFSLSKTDEIESFDIWLPGKNPLSIAPTYTMDIAGVGISKAIYLILDFITDTKEMYAFYQGLKEDINEDDIPLRHFCETKIDAYIPIAAQFFTENPQYLTPIVNGSGGYQNGSPAGREVLHAMQAYPGLSKQIPINVAAVNSLGKKAVQSNPSIAQGINVSPAQAKSGANSVPSPTISSLAAGPSLTLTALFDSIPEAAEYKAQVADANRPDGPLGIIYDFTDPAIIH